MPSLRRVHIILLYKGNESGEHLLGCNNVKHDRIIFSKVLMQVALLFIIIAVNYSYKCSHKTGI